MSAPCADSNLKVSLQEAPFRGKTLLAWLILRAYQDGYGLVRLPQQDLADLLDIRHPRNLAPILRPLTETGRLMIIPGQGRGHPTLYLLAEERTDDALLAILTTRVGLTEEEARERLGAWHMEQKSPASPELFTAHSRHSPSELPPKSTARAEPLTKTSAPAELFQAKPSARAEPFHPKSTAESELFPKTSGIAEPFISKSAAPAELLSGKPSAPAELFTKTSGAAEPFIAKSAAPAVLFQKTSAPEELFVDSLPENASLDHARAGSRAHDLAAANNKSIQKIKQQQQQSLRADLASAREEGSEIASNRFTLQDAFQYADIQPPTTRYIAREWRERKGRSIALEDVLAWHFYRLHENQRKRPGAEPLEPGYIITRMRQGERADQAFYEQAREFLADLHAPNEPEPAEQEYPALLQALEAFLPPVAEAGIEARDAQRTRLPPIARDLAERGVDAETISDLLLYLAYTDRPLPPPDDVGSVLKQLGNDFRAWRQRRKEAVRRWRQARTQLQLSYPAATLRPLDGTIPLDWAEDTLIVGVKQQTALELLRTRWRSLIQRHASLQIQCRLLQKKATEASRPQ